MLPQEYLPIVVWIIIAAAVPFIIKLLNWVLSPPGAIPRHSKKTYECGERPIGVAQVRYSPQFYTFAIAFVLFDILSVFLVTWALIFRDTRIDQWLAISTISVFCFALFFGLAFWFRQKAILWG